MLPSLTIGTPGRLGGYGARFSFLLSYKQGRFTNLQPQGRVVMDIYSSEQIGKCYNIIADLYGQERSPTWGANYVQQFLHMLPAQTRKAKSPTVLDIGCGNGIPITRQLVSSGANVIGLDISTRMIEKAKANVPRASFIRGDILTAQFQRKFDGVVAWDSLFHIPLRKQEQVIKKVIGLLYPNGVFIFTAGGKQGELISEMFGTEFYYSSLSAEKYENILKENDCEMIINEIDDPSSHGHRIICCRKIAR